MLGRDSPGFKKADGGSPDPALAGRSLILQASDRIVELEMESAEDREEFVQALSRAYPDY